MLADAVLVVEDEAILAMLIEEALIDAGFESVVAGSAQDAIDILRTSDHAPLALITDVRLPSGSGWHVGEAARARFPHIPVIYTSGDSGLEWRQRGVSASVFLQKPIAGRAIVEKIQELAAA